MIRSFLAASLILLIAGCKTNCQPDADFQRIEALCETLKTLESPHLTAAELARFSSDITKLNQVRIGQAMNALQEPWDESRFIPSSALGQPFTLIQDRASKAPMKILAAAFVRKNPSSPTLTRFIFKESSISKAEAIIEELVAYDPKRAWEFAQDHRQFLLERHPTSIQAYSIVDPIFSELAKQKNPIRFEFLKQDSRFQGNEAAQFHMDALYGLFRGSRDDTAQLEEFLDWLTEPDGRRILQESAKIRPPRYDFPTFDFDLPSQALAYLALQDPRKATRWVASKKQELNFNWPVSIFAGWLSFWPTTPDRIPDWESRVSDALDWVALNDRNPPKDLVEAVRYGYGIESSQRRTFAWVDAQSPNPKIQQAKVTAKEALDEVFFSR